MSKIKCRLCNSEYSATHIGNHISKTHKMDYMEYAKLYWEDLPNWSPCEICGEVCKATYCSNICYKIGHSKKLKGKKQPPRTEEHSRKISEAAKKRLSNPENHHMYGKHHSAETLMKISNTQKIKFSNSENHPMYGKTHTIESIQKMSKSHKGLLAGEKNPMYGKTHTPEAIKKIFQKRPMNKLEKKVANWLDVNNIPYSFQFFISEGDVCKSYDFKIKDTNIILEVHGDYWHGGDGVDKHVFNVDDVVKNDELKVELAKARGYVVKVVWQREIVENIEVLKDVIFG
jgi:G:T-mismatch repair DNA endonuclease (very short patch repair protein)